MCDRDTKLPGISETWSKNMRVTWLYLFIFNFDNYIQNNIKDHVQILIYHTKLVKPERQKILNHSAPNYSNSNWPTRHASLQMAPDR